MKDHYLHLRPGSDLPSLSLQPFIGLVIVQEPASTKWRSSLADWLVDTGCLYAVVWGHDCEDIHDRIDWANLERFDYGVIPDEKFIMTTWHARQPLSEALWFAAVGANHPDVDLRDTLIVDVAAHETEKRLLARLRTARSGGWLTGTIG